MSRGAECYPTVHESSKIHREIRFDSLENLAQRLYQGYVSMYINYYQYMSWFVVPDPPKV